MNISGENEVLSQEEDIALQKILGEKWASDLQKLMKSKAWLENAELVAFLKEPLMRLCARYLYLEKHRSAALNGVGMSPYYYCLNFGLSLYIFLCCYFLIFSYS